MADDHSLSIALAPTTQAACPPGSLSDQFSKSLGQVQSYLFDGDNLILQEKMDSGTLRFTAVNVPLTATASATATATITATLKPWPTATPPVKPATTLDFKVDVVGCRNTPTAEKPGGILLLFRFEPTGAPGPYRYFDADEDKEVPQLYERPASLGSRVIVTWAVQAADGQRLEKKQDYDAGSFAEVGCK